MAKDKQIYQNVTGWENDDYISLVCKFTPEFLEELLDKFDEGDPDVVDDYDENDPRVKFNISLRYSEYEGTDFYGSAYISQPKSKKRKRGKKNKR